jgi:DNA-binding NtrC family response regulator
MGIAILDPDKETVTLLAELIAETGASPSPFTSKDKFLEAIDPKTHCIAIISDEFVGRDGRHQTGLRLHRDHRHRDVGRHGVSQGRGLALPEETVQSRGNHPGHRGAQCARGSQATDDGAPFVVADPSMARIMDIVRKVAPTQAPVSSWGNRAKARKSLPDHPCTEQEKRRALRGINLAAIKPETLLESELFGYEKGAFTGAYDTRGGRFEQADGGTILLDEVTEIGFGLQAKLLRVLQERQIDRVGGKAPIRVDFRVISTTNRTIEEEIRAGRFRNDLFFRLNVIPIMVPALRDRGGHPPPGAHFIRKIAAREGMQEKVLSPGKRCPSRYPWPGNVRRWKNVIERAMILTEGDTISFGPCHDGELRTGTCRRPPGPGTTITKWKNASFSHLAEGRRQQDQGATLLGISIRTLRNKLNEYTRAGQFSDDPPAGADCADPEFS